MQPLMEKLGSKLSSSEVKVQKKAITFIAVIAGQALRALIYQKSDLTLNRLDEIRRWMMLSHRTTVI